MTETVKRLSSLVHRPLEYKDESIEEARAWRSEFDVPEWEVDTWVGSYLAIAAGEFGETSDTVEHLTGRAPYRLDEYFSERPNLLALLREESQ